MSVSITQSMYDYATSWPEKTYTHISPSTIGRCMRSHYYRIKGIEQTTPPGPGAQLNFELGRMWEKPVEDGLRHMGATFISQLYLKDDELNLAGTLDFAILDNDTNEWTVVDSKTEGMNAQKYRKRQRQSFFESHPEYVHQLAAYALLMRRKGFTVPKGRVVIITKDNGMLDEQDIMLSDELIKKTLARVVKLNKYLQANKVPPCECEGWQIGYCNYGNPNTQAPNSTKKIVNTECCGTPEQIEIWRKA